MELELISDNPKDVKDFLFALVKDKRFQDIVDGGSESVYQELNIIAYNMKNATSETKRIDLYADFVELVRLFVASMAHNEITKSYYRGLEDNVDELIESLTNE